MKRFYLSQKLEKSFEGFYARSCHDHIHILENHYGNKFQVELDGLGFGNGLDIGIFIKTLLQSFNR